MCAGRRELRGHGQEDRMLSGIMQLVFLSPFTSVPAEEGKQDWQEGSGAEAGLNTFCC